MILTHLIMFSFFPGADTAAAAILVYGPVCMADQGVYVPGVVDKGLYIPGVQDGKKECS